jgi:chorismate dehydratase
MRRLRVSAISFLNTAPLMWDFEQGKVPASSEVKIAGNLEIAYTVPSRCARELARGGADIGIIPAITYASVPNLAILPDVAIAARGPVRSILLVSKVPQEKIRSVATDSSSRTSVALAEVLFRNFLGGQREFQEMEPDLEPMLRQHDAALLIGDSALRIPLQGSGYEVYDLAEMWRRYTGHSFVFAFWAIRMLALQEADREQDVAQIFRESRDHGLEPENVEQIARLWAPHLGISELEIRNYLTQNIHYFFDDDACRGLELFYRYAAECGLIAAAPPLRFLGTPAGVEQAVSRP